MRVKSFDYFSLCTIVLYFLVDLVNFNKAATVEERSASKTDDNFSDITAFQSSNQKFTIYRNAVKRECYVEIAPTLTTNSDQKPLSRTLFVGKSKITSIHAIYGELGQDVLDSCKNFSIFNLEERPSSTIPKRRKRQVIQPKKSYFKGQTQTQFISFDNEGKNDKGGTAEATAEQDKSRATVQGRMGMGQAQSQSGSGDPCEECAGSIRTTEQFSSVYPGSSYPTNQGSNILPTTGRSSQQEVNGSGQYGGGLLYPFGNGYLPIEQPSASGIPRGSTPSAGVDVHGSGQKQAGTTYPSSGSQGTGLLHPQQMGYPSGYFPSQTGVSGSDAAPGGTSNYPQGYGQTGYNAGSGQPGYISERGSSSSPQTEGSQSGGQQIYNSQGRAGGSQGREGGGEGTGGLRPTGYIPQSSVAPGSSQGGGALYPPRYVSQSGGDLSYPSGYVPLLGTGSDVQGGLSYPSGYVPQSGTGLSVQGGGASYPSGYVPQLRMGSGIQEGGGRGILYPSGYVPQSGTGSGVQGGGTLYPSGYVPQSGTGSGVQGGGILYPSGYVPQSGTGSGVQGGGILYPLGYIPQSKTGSGVQGGGASYPSGYIPQLGTGSGVQGGGTTYPPGYIPQSGTGSDAQTGGSSYPSGYVPQSGTGSGVQGGGALNPQSSGYTPGRESLQRPSQGYIPQLGVSEIQGGSTYPQQLASGYGQPTSNQFPVGGMTYPQQSTYFPQGSVSVPLYTPQQVYGPQIVSNNAEYPSQPAYSPQNGVGSQQSRQSTGNSAPGLVTHPRPGAISIPGGENNPRTGTQPLQIGDTFSRQGSAAVLPQPTTLQNAGGVLYPQTSYPPGTSFTPQDILTGQANVNYPLGSTGYYPFIPAAGPGTVGQPPVPSLPSSQTNFGQTQGGNKGIDTSSGSQITPIDTAAGESQSLSSLNINPNGTKAAASAQGKTRNGMSQVQISGTYTGSFSAQAQTGDNEKSVQAEIFGNTTAASSSSQGKAGKSGSQSQILYNYNTGASLAESQGSGINYNTNTQIQAGNRGGIADSQSTGSGSSSSQAQIGFLPSDSKRKDQTALFEGGGTSSSQNSASSGQSQTQFQGSFKSGISFIGSAQSSSGRAQNKTKLVFDPSDLSFPLDDSSKANTLVEQPSRQAVRKENNIVKSTIPLSSLPQNDHTGVNKNMVPDNTSPQYQDTVIKTQKPDSESSQYQDAVIKTQKYDAYIERDSSDLKSTFNAGDLVPGTDNYRIPTGFRGRVTSKAGDTTHATASSLGNAQTQTVLLKPGKGRVTINDHNRSDQQNFQNDANISNKRDVIDEYVTVTKSETGELSGDKKFSHAYYTKSSTCGYFTFTCNYIDGSNGKSKICKPGPLTYSDGTPCR